MAIRIAISPSLKAKLKAKLGNLPAAATVALMIELYRQGHISHGEFAHSLGLSRYEADGVLKRHGVTEDLVTSTELELQVEGFRRRLHTTQFVA